MNKNKVLSLILILTLILNIMLPSVSLAIEEISEQIENEDIIDTQAEEEILEQEDSINDEIIIENREDNIENSEDEEDLEEEIPQTTIMSMNTLEVSNINFSAKVSVNGYDINTYLSDGIYYIFLPKTIDITALQIHYTYALDVSEITSGVVDSTNKSIVNDFSKNDTLSITFKDNKKYTIKVMQSDIPSICINIKNNIVLKTVHSNSKDIKYDSTMQIVGAGNNSYNISDDNIQFKGRGNSTWQMDKRGYQIKLDKKQNLLGIGNGKSKKWVLLANQVDRSLLRNKVAYDLGVKLGLTNIPNAEFVDLYVNGDYLGNYLLCDKVETGDTRVKLTNQKGVLVEMDNFYGKGEQYNFTTKYTGTTFALKESYAGDNDLGSTAEKTALASFENAMNKFEKALSNSNTKWSQIEKMIDVESFAKLYLIMELAEDPDSFNSSMYFYKDGDDDLIHAGPVWDFDVALGYHKVTEKGGNTNVDYILDYKSTWYDQLMRYNQFVNLVNNTYNNQVKVEFHNISSSIDEDAGKMKASVAMNFTKWKNFLGNTFETPITSANGKDYNSEVNYLKKWISKRVTYMDKRYSLSSVEYKTHVEDYGWMSVKKDGSTAGTEGQSKRMESIRIVAPTNLADAHICYQAHIQNIGWQPWVKEGELAGTEGQGLRMEAIRINLLGVPNYSVMYRVHIQNIGWQEWKYNGEIAGTEDQSLRIEAIEIRVLKTDYVGSSKILSSSNINYSAHIQDISWSGYGADGETIGTKEKSARLEAIKIKLNNDNIKDTNITYKVHIQDIGWQNWKTNGEIAGTEGQSLRLEAIRVNIDNDKYKVKYRVYIQNIGWQEWKENGEMAGTEGQSLRLEAIEIKLVEN